MDLNFAEFLEEYVPIMPESIKDGILNRLTYSENLTKISFYITFPHLVPAGRTGTRTGNSAGNSCCSSASTVCPRIVFYGIFSGSGHVSETGNDRCQRFC